MSDKKGSGSGSEQSNNKTHYPSKTRRKLAAVSAIDQETLENFRKQNETQNVQFTASVEEPFPVVETLIAEDPKIHIPIPISSTKRLILSVTLMLLATVIGVANTQLSKQTYSKTFDAPFLMMYTNQLVRVFTFPIFLIFTGGVAWVKKEPFSIRSQLKKGLLFLGPGGPTILSVIKIVCVLGMSSLIGLGLYLSTLRYISASESTTLMTSQVAMIYVISAVFFKQPVLALKIFATVLSFTGVGLTAYANGFNSDSFIGVILALAGAVVYALDQVYMKVVLKYPDLAQACLFMNSTAIFVLLIGWTFPLAMKLTDIEIWEFNTAPWLLVFGGGVTALMSALVINYGISVASPFYMSMYNLLRIPVNNLIDTYGRGETFSAFEIAGAVCIAVGFLLIVLPDEKVSIRIRQRLNFKKNTLETENIEMIGNNDLIVSTISRNNNGINKTVS